MSKAIPALWTNQLNEVLFAHPLTRSHFRGTYGCDKIPNPHTVDHAGRFRPWTMVVNTQPSTSVGEHWLLLSADIPTLNGHTTRTSQRSCYLKTYFIKGVILWILHATCPWPYSLSKCGISESSNVFYTQVTTRDRYGK